MIIFDFRERPTEIGADRESNEKLASKLLLLKKSSVTEEPTSLSFSVAHRTQGEQLEASMPNRANDPLNEVFKVIDGDFKGTSI